MRAASVMVGAANERPEVFMSESPFVAYGDALIYLARMAQQQTGTGARKLCIAALEREHDRVKGRELETSGNRAKDNVP